MTVVNVLRSLVKENEATLKKIYGTELHTEKIYYNKSGKSLSKDIMKVGLGFRYKVSWVLNNEIDNCMRCYGDFNYLKWKHHCRICGYLICNSCSLKKMKIKEIYERYGSRICYICNSNINYDRDSLTKIGQYNNPLTYQETLSVSDYSLRSSKESSFCYQEGYIN